MFTNRGNSDYLVEFRAGRMNLVGKMLHADPRKGLVYLHHTDDGLVHFCWKDRQTDKTEDDLIVFPDDFEYKHVGKCTTGRVYVLKSKNSSYRRFFWMQEINADRDAELCRRVNEIMNKPQASRQQCGGKNLSALLVNNLSQMQLMHLLNGDASMSEVSTLLDTLNRDTSDAVFARSNTSASSSNSTVSTVDMETIAQNMSNNLVSSNAVSNLMDNDNKTKVLSVHLPKDEVYADTERKQKLHDTLASPSFQVALKTFCSGLVNGQLGPVASQFKLSADAVSAAYLGDLEGFLKALEAGVSTINAENDYEAMDTTEPKDDKKNE